MSSELQPMTSDLQRLHRDRNGCRSELLRTSLEVQPTSSELHRMSSDLQPLQQ